MKLKYLTLPVLVLFLLGCSTDDSVNDNPEPPEIPVASFVTIGTDAENVYQFDFDGPSETGQLANLTLTSNVTPNYLTLRQAGDLLSFYFFSQGAFSLILRDARTGADGTFVDFFANSPGRSVAWGINDESNVFFGFFGPEGTRNFGIQDVNLQSGFTQDTSIDVDIDFIFQPILFDGKVYFAYQTNSGDFKFTYYNTTTQSTGPKLNFGNIPISFLVTQSGEMAIVKNGVNATLELYDADALTLLETLPLQFNTGFSAGPVDGAVFDADVLYYAFPYVQPSEYPAGPASFNIDTQENNLVDFFGIADEVESSIGQNIGLTVQLYDPLQNVFFVGYEVLDQSARGGVLQIGANGKLIANVTTDFVPTYFVRN